MLRTAAHTEKSSQESSHARIASSRAVPLCILDNHSDFSPLYLAHLGIHGLDDFEAHEHPSIDNY